jgi:ATP-dependent protease HslVU (ClpYQ) peptidase subunit
MTCIVGLEHKGYVYFGSDAAVSGESTITIVPPSEKLFQINNVPIVMGVCGSVRLMQLIQYGFKYKIDNDDEKNDTAYLVNNFVVELQSFLEEKGDILVDNNNLPSDCELLLGYNKKLWRIDTDFQVRKSNVYDAIGSGELIALGVIEALKDVDTITPEQKVLKALDAASIHIQSVRGPYHQLKLGKNSLTVIKQKHEKT